MSAVSRFPVANPMVIFREELDEWAVLFDPDANETFALDPTSVFIWKLLDGKHCKEDILTKLNEACNDTPEDAPQHLDEFLEELAGKSLIGVEK
ncbi:MAG: PqqD family peptide modification chaperone [Victivallaceae bacterium]|nr:PqqD family peptide modification chaperone [Victivallaceae bacterium]